MADEIQDLVEEAEQLAAEYRAIQAKYPDACRGVVYDQCVVASKKALPDTNELVVFHSWDIRNKPALLVPIVRVGTTPLIGWNAQIGVQLEQALQDLKRVNPDAYQALLKVCRA